MIRVLDSCLEEVFESTENSWNSYAYPPDPGLFNPTGA